MAPRQRPRRRPFAESRRRRAIHQSCALGKFVAARPKGIGLKCCKLSLYGYSVLSCTEDVQVQINPNAMANTSHQDLAAAAANLTRLRAWVLDLYPMGIEYETAVFNLLQSTPENGDWTNFVVNTMIDIGILMMAGAAIAGGVSAAVPAIAGLSAFLHDWGIGKDRPNNLPGFFAKFQLGHEKMQELIEQRLSSLVDPKDNYKNLSEAWKDKISFNGNTYTIGDLASSNFPGLGDSYNALQKAALKEFKKALWNLAIMKTCKYWSNYEKEITLPKGAGTTVAVRNWAQQNLYKTNPGVFLRYAYIDTDNNPPPTNTFQLHYWNLGINGYELPPNACKELFMDDTPGHIINPDGLFNRVYVFEQFATTQPQFGDWRDLSDGTPGPKSPFTGGAFPEETKKTKDLLVIPGPMEAHNKKAEFLTSLAELPR